MGKNSAYSAIVGRTASPDRFDLKPYRDSEGEDINPFMPMIDLDDGGDEFGDLKEEILLGVDDPNVGIISQCLG